MRALGLALTLFTVGSCTASAFDLQGHRGARGHLPENTLPAFRKAIEFGVTTLETDLALTRDGHLVLSHERRLNPDLTRDEEGRWVDVARPTIRSLTLQELQRFDVGRLKPQTRYATQWPQQVPVDGTRIPTLAQLIAFANGIDPRIRFNIETKISPDMPGDAADPETFANAVVEAVGASGSAERITVQSFDWRTLIAIKRLAPSIPTVCLTIDTQTTSTLRAREGKPSPWLGGLDPEAHGGSVPRTVKASGCSTWSPFWRNVTAVTVSEAQMLGLKVIPWTVNDPVDMATLIDLKIDGLITDYPDRARDVLAAKGITASR